MITQKIGKKEYLLRDEWDAKMELIEVTHLREKPSRWARSHFKSTIHINNNKLPKNPKIQTTYA